MRGKKWIATLLAIVMGVAILPATVFAAGPTDSSVNRIADTETWYGDMTESFDKLSDYWYNVVKTPPAGYLIDDETKTVSIGNADALVWWAKQVNAGQSFAGCTVNITADIDLSAHYWTPICTGTVSYNGGKYSIASNTVLEGVTINGGGHTITGLTTATGVRGPNQDSQPGDGNNCYYDSAFIGFNSCNLTIQGLTFSDASVAISDPFDEVTNKYGSSMIAVIVGGQSGGSLTLKNVAVKNANVLAMQKASAFVGNLMGNSKLVVDKCEISNSTFSAYFMVAPIAGYASSSQVTVKSIKLSNNTINVVEQSGMQYSENKTTGAEYWDGDLNACTTALFYDGSSEYGDGTELTFAAELDGYLYVNAEDAVHNVSKVESQNPTCTEDGNREYWYCNDCGKYFSDADCTEAIMPEDVVIPAKGHSFEDGKCAVCGATVTVDVEDQPAIDTTTPTETIQVGVDKANDTVDLGQEVSDVINDITSGNITTSVNEETAKKIEDAVISGSSITVEVMYDNNIAVTENEKNLANKITAADETVAGYFDLSIILKAGDKELGNLTQLSKPMTFKVAIPTDFIKEGREYFIIRIHNGLAEKLDTTLNEDGTLSFSTDKFSTYALAYADQAGTQVVDPEKDHVPHTSDNSNTLPWIILLFASGSALGLMGYSKKKKQAK